METAVLIHFHPRRIPYWGLARVGEAQHHITVAQSSSLCADMNVSPSNAQACPRRCSPRMRVLNKTVCGPWRGLHSGAAKGGIHHASANRDTRRHWEAKSLWYWEKSAWKQNTIMNQLRMGPNQWLCGTPAVPSPGRGVGAQVSRLLRVHRTQT